MRTRCMTTSRWLPKWWGIGSLVLALMIAVSASLSIARSGSSDAWAMTLKTPLGDPVFINYNQLDRNGSVLIPTLDEPSRKQLFHQAIRALEGGTRVPPTNRILEVEMGSASDFYKWYYDQAADRRFADQVIRSGGRFFADSINRELGNPDPMIRIELMRIVIQGKVQVSDETLGRLLTDSRREIQFLALTVIAGRPGQSALSAAATRMAFARSDADEFSCLGLRLSEPHWSDAAPQRAAWALLSSMATHGIDYRLARELNVYPASCDVRLVLRVLVPSSEEARKETLARLSEFVASNQSFTRILASTVAMDPAFSTYWTPVFVPYWRSQVSRYLGNEQNFPIGVLFPEYRIAADALARIPSVEDAQLLLRLATHHSPFAGDVLARSIEAFAATDSLGAHSYPIVDALTRFSEQLKASHGSASDINADAFNAFAAHVAALNGDANTAEAIWKMVSRLRSDYPALAEKLTSAIDSGNVPLAEAIAERFPEFNPARIRDRLLEATCWAAPEFSACDFFKRLNPEYIETAWGMNASQKREIISSNFKRDESVCAGPKPAWYVSQVDLRSMLLEQCTDAGIEGVELRVYRKSTGGHLGTVIAMTGNHGLYQQFKFFDIPGDSGPLKPLSSEDVGIPLVRANELLAEGHYFPSEENELLSLGPATDDKYAIEALPGEWNDPSESPDVVRRILFIWDGTKFQKKVQQVSPER